MSRQGVRDLISFSRTKTPKPNIENESSQVIHKCIILSSLTPRSQLLSRLSLAINNFTKICTVSRLNSVTHRLCGRLIGTQERVCTNCSYDQRTVPESVARIKPDDSQPGSFPALETADYPPSSCGRGYRTIGDK